MLRPYLVRSNLESQIQLRRSVPFLWKVECYRKSCRDIWNTNDMLLVNVLCFLQRFTATCNRFSFWCCFANNAYCNIFAHAFCENNRTENNEFTDVHLGNCLFRKKRVVFSQEQILGLKCYEVVCHMICGFVCESKPGPAVYSIKYTLIYKPIFSNSVLLKMELCLISITTQFSRRDDCLKQNKYLRLRAIIKCFIVSW